MRVENLIFQNSHNNFSSEFPPTLVAEITQKGSKLYDKTSEEIVELVIKDLLRLGIVKSREQIAKTDMKLIEYTWPIPVVGSADLKEQICEILRKHRVYLLGRSGKWDYLNMDGVILNVEKFITENAYLLNRV